MSTAMDETVLYRFYDDEVTLLYVGITAQPSVRFSAHSNDLDGKITRYGRCPGARQKPAGVGV